MSLKDTSIDERSIISSLAATRSFSAVLLLAGGSLVGTPVFNSEPMTSACTELSAQLIPWCALTQELIG
ncbi:hypothetical protein GALL_458570 [mine drainage metagenome]|uniref:Uncharacterized protein n=1 Tax=mine drainage metagenome TaxID=410659 RepID=A0A1J5Q4Y7_9ZZZZ